MSIPNTVIAFLCFLVISCSSFANDQIEASFKLNGIEQGIFLPVTINDLPYTLLFDTGATFTVLDSSFKPLMGKPLKRTEAETIVGQTDVLLYNPVDIYADGYNLTTKHPFLLSDFEFLQKVAGITFHGVLGMANLYEHVWDMNFDERMLLIKSQPYEENSLRSFTRLRITPEKVGIPTIPVEIGNEQINFLLDSGDNGFGRVQKEIIDSLIEKNLVSSVATDSIVSISGVAEVRRIRVNSVKVGKNVYKNVVMRESLQNALGLGFLTQHHVIMDFPNRNFFFKKGLGTFQVDREDKSGLKLISHNNQVVVALVDERGPAAKAGIKKGDIVTKLHGTPVSGKDLFKLRNLFMGKDGDKILLNVVRSNENVVIAFELEEGFDFVVF